MHTKLALLAALTLSTTWAHGKPPPKGKPGPDPRLQQIRTDLEGTFRYWDANNDNVLDTDELAKGFRGKEAQSYAAQNGSGARPDPKELKKFPDFTFQMQWDKSRDDKVSESEFGEFVQSTVNFYRPLLKQHDEITHKLQNMQLRLTEKGINAARRATIKAEMMTLSTQLQVAHEGFQHQRHLEAMAARASLRKTSWNWHYSWYRHN